MGTKQFGMLYESSPIEYDRDLSEFTKAEITHLIGLQSSSEADVQATLDRYKKEMAKTSRLHLRNAHSKYAVSTIEHFRFLVSIGCEIECVPHAVLFATMTAESQRIHPYRKTIGGMLAARESMQKAIAELEQLEAPSSEQENRIALLKTLAFLAKIR